VSLKRIIYRGAGYARRRDRSRYSRQRAISPKEQEEIRAFTKAFQNQAFGCLIVFVVGIFAYVGVQLLWQGIAHILGFE
jgi:hypothetical protein